MMIISASVICTCGTIVSIDFYVPHIIPKCPNCKKPICKETWEDLFKTLDTFAKSEQINKNY
jgi:hypothetical protein